jgi:hypothetical protein
MKQLIAIAIFCLLPMAAFAQQQPNPDLTDYAKMLEAYRQGDQLQIMLLQHQIAKQAKDDADKEKADIAAVNKWWCGKACEPKVPEHQRP